MMDFLSSIEHLRFSTWIREGGSNWGYPAVLFLHVVGMGLVAGIISLIALRLLGFAPKIPIKPMEKLYTTVWLGFFINTVTGIILLMADATTKLTNPDFYVKMVFVLSGIAIFAKMRTKVFALPTLDQAPVSANAKGWAYASLVCWMGAILAGRLMAYVGPVSGLALPK
jgi:hypothetical protein